MISQNQMTNYRSVLQYFSLFSQTLFLNRNTKHRYYQRYVTRTGSDRAQAEIALPHAPGRYRSRYRTNVTCFDLAPPLHFRCHMNQPSYWRLPQIILPWATAGGREYSCGCE